MLALGRQVWETQGRDDLLADVQVEVLHVWITTWGDGELVSGASSGMMASASCSMLSSVGRCRMGWQLARSTSRCTQSASRR